MATQATVVVNPTAADVTVNSKTALKQTATLLQIDDAVVTEYNGFLAAGCALIRNAAGTEESRELAGFLMERLQSQF